MAQSPPSRLLKRHKPYFPNPGKENTPPLSLTPNLDDPFHRTLGGCYTNNRLQPISGASSSLNSTDSSVGVSGFDSETPEPPFYTCKFQSEPQKPVCYTQDVSFRSNSMESRLLSRRKDNDFVDGDEAFHRTLGGSYTSGKLQPSDTSNSWNLMDSGVSIYGFDSESLESSFHRCKSQHGPQKPTCYTEAVSLGSNLIESRLLSSSVGQRDDSSFVDDDGDEDEGEFESCTQLDLLVKLCSGEDELCPPQGTDTDQILGCPLCGLDISQWDEEARLLHANECLDKSHSPTEIPAFAVEKPQFPSEFVHKASSPSTVESTDFTLVTEWLHSLGLAKYEAAFIQQEIDWDSLQCLTEEDLISIGVTALGPRKKILQSIKELGKKENLSTVEMVNDGTEHTVDVTKKLTANRLITDYFLGPSYGKKMNITSARKHVEKVEPDSQQRQGKVKNTRKGKNKVIPLWCSIPGTSFRVDAFQYLRRDCSDWFLTHFHLDHYQGLTKSFSYGKIYCSKITAKLVNLKIGIPWERLQVMPLNQKINIAGVDVTFYDANHCPGSTIILFEPPNCKPVLHTGDFRFNEEVAQIFATQSCRIHTLILDTTYCNPQYNFPKQETVIQFVIEAIQAESFNQKTLFLIGSYTIGKERLFLEVARVLRKKIYVGAAKLRLLECLELSAEDMQWLTPNERESHIHVVPMWTIASFKRLKQLSSRYAERFSLIVAFSPTGWSLSKGRKTAGRRYQQGTVIRYEVPYSEHSSFEELKEFVKLISPTQIIPSVNNDSVSSSNEMITLLSSQ